MQTRANFENEDRSYAHSMNAIQYCGAALVFLSSVSLLFLFVVSVAPYARAFVGTESADDIYKICLAKMKPGVARAKDPVGQMMLSQFTNGMCESLRTECERSPDGEKCQTIRRVITNVIRS